MSHRYRSHCCCGVEELPEDRPVDCFLGWGTPPSTPFSPVNSKDRGGLGIPYSQTFYANAQGKNPHDNWDACSHSLDRELIVSLERYTDMDSRNEGAYFSSGNFEGDPKYCGDVNNTGIPVIGANSSPNRPLYARYRRLNGFSDFDDFNDATRNWSNHPGQPMERNYLWAVQRIGPIWNEDDRAYNAFNSNSASYPLLFNPNAEDQLPSDFFYPHGTHTDTHCGGFSNSSIACDDCICTTQINNCSSGFNAFSFCDYEHKGMANKPLTKAQSHMIGNNWNTSENGFIPTLGHSRGQSSIATKECPEDPDNFLDYPFHNRVKEYGGAYFWLQGISDHTENYRTEDGRQRIYRSFSVSGNYDLVQNYRNSTCTQFPYGLWPLQSTLLGVFRREAWWELYWSGFSKRGFEALGINHPVPDNSYFLVDGNPDDPDNPGYDPSILSESRLPSYIGFGCSGIPVFSWEIAYLYFDPDGTDSFHAGQQNITNEQAGYAIPEMFIGDGILDYEIPNSVFAFYKNIFSDNEVIFNLLDSIQSNQTNSIQSRCEAHRVLFCICFAYDLPLPTQITDCLEDYNILPQAVNYGEEFDYKIFKKKIVYNKEGDFPTEQQKAACCINLGDYPVGNSSFSAEDRAEFSGDPEKSILCDLTPNFCAPTGCTDPECENAVVNIADDDYCIKTEWDDDCVALAATIPECLASTTCVNATPFDCIYKWGGIISDEGITCPNDSGNIFDSDNSNFCSADFQGICCISKKETIADAQDKFVKCEDIDADSIEAATNRCNELASDYDEKDPNNFWVYSGNYFQHVNCETGSDYCPGYEQPDIDWDNENFCNYLADPVIEDFYFYGAVGGWAWYCPFALDSFYKINTDLGKRNGSCWNAVPFPVETKFYSWNPAANNSGEFYEKCCVDQDDGEPIGWCENAEQFVFCNSKFPPDIFGEGQDLYEPPDGSNDQYPDDTGTGLVSMNGIPITCSNQSATITCRGAWWQWQKYDYDIHNPNALGAAIYTGCDSINNAFWLVQDPYPVGPRFELGITTDSSGQTLGMVDGIIGKEPEILRGYNNVFGASGLLSTDIEEQFKGPTYAVQYECGSETIDVTMRSNGFLLIMRGDEPDFTNNDSVDTQYFYSRSTRFYRDGLPTDPNAPYIFNPFEKLDKLEETKSDPQSWWQLIESYQGVNSCQGETIVINELKQVPNVYGKINIEDAPDPEYEQFQCDQSRIKYTQEAARIVEYQWYHPPYVLVMGDPGLAQLRGARGGRIWCSDLNSQRYIQEWGACCNSVPFLGNSTWISGAKMGPAPVERDDDSDRYLPGPPNEVQR